MVKPVIEKPEYWSKDWYIQMKKQGHHDDKLAEMLFVSMSTFNKWKRELELPKFIHTFSNAKGRS